MKDFLKIYLDNEPIAVFKNALLDGSLDQDTIKELFDHPIKFGTAGLRGLMQPGLGGINGYTIGRATTGLAHFLKKKHPSKKLTVCISYDNRHHSMQFAQIATQVLAHYNIDVKLSHHLRPTPWLSFAVKFYKADAGIMITASHNPKNYNGFKVYLSDGAQVSSPYDQQIMDEILKVDDLFLAPIKNPHIELVDEECDRAYLLAIQKFHPVSHSDLSIVYSPLCGTGITLLPKALEHLGFHKIHYVEEEIINDPEFANIKSPNPETLTAAKRSTELLLKEKLDIALLTDPDADRLGCVVNHHGVSYPLTGNQIALILLDFLIKNTKDLQEKVVVSSFVTTKLIEDMCKKNGLTHKSVLTGFKYIGGVIEELEQKKKEDLFLLGAEESYGYLIGTHAKDKDAIISSTALCLAADLAKKQHKTLVDTLNAIYQEYGLSVEENYTFEFPEGTKPEAIKKKMDQITQSIPSKLFGEEVLFTYDYQNKLGKDLKTHQSFELAYPTTQALGMSTKSGYLIIRPSGTEPKIKFYAGFKAKAIHDIETQKSLIKQMLLDEMKQI
jgi:phosphomannomutase